MNNLCGSIIVSIILPLCFSCAFVPINNQYEKAGTLQKGNLEVAGSFTGNSVSNGAEGENINNNFGVRVGYGVSDKFDLKIRYERLTPSNRALDEFKGANYFSIVPKLALIPGKFALLIPFSHYTYKDEFTGDEPGNLTSIAPQLLYTFTNKSRKADLTLGTKADLLIGGDGAGVLVGFTVGAGFSSDLDRWAIRPELGASLIGEGAFLNYGIGLQFIIPKRSKR